MSDQTSPRPVQGPASWPSSAKPRPHAPRPIPTPQSCPDLFSCRRWGRLKGSIAHSHARALCPGLVELQVGLHTMAKYRCKLPVLPCSGRPPLLLTLARDARGEASAERAALPTRAACVCLEGWAACTDRRWARVAAPTWIMERCGGCLCVGGWVHVRVRVYMSWWYICHGG
jgi:hypothetical protein